MSEARADNGVANEDPRANAESMMASVGLEVQRLRKAKELTLEQVSKRASVSIGLISQIERGRGNPSFNTLVQVAHALSVPVGRLFHTASDASPVVRAGERRALDLPSNGSVEAVHQLLTPDLRGSLEVIWVEAPPGYDTSDAPFVHPGEEFGLVLTGTHEVTVDGVTHTLGPGDSITYASTAPHYYRNPGPETVTAVWVITPPTF